MGSAAASFRGSGCRRSSGLCGELVVLNRPDCDCGKRLHWLSLGPVAQRLEQGTHNPLVVCSNHTGPTLVSIRVFQHGLLLRGCGLTAPGSGTVSTTVSKRPPKHPLDGLEGRSGRVRPDDTNWTGAEIKSCCRLASLLDVPLAGAAQNVVPVAVTAGDKIEQLRQWASGRCLSADRAGVYSREQGQDRASVTGSRARRVIREPGVN